MSDALVERYQRATDDLGARKKWYQTATDPFFVAVLVAVDDLAAAEVWSAGEAVDAAAPRSDPLHYINYTAAAVAHTNGVAPETLVASTGEATDALAGITRMKGARVCASAILASAGSGWAYHAAHLGDIYDLWNEQHRMLTTPDDVSLAAITQLAGVDPRTALDRAVAARSRLEDRGYRYSWDIARILALDPSPFAIDRFLGLADTLRGRRRRVLTDRRRAVAWAALADHPHDELIALVSDRVETVRVGRFRPDASTRVLLASLLTLGGSTSESHPLRVAFRGAVLAEHFAKSMAESSS